LIRRSKAFLPSKSLGHEYIKGALIYGMFFYIEDLIFISITIYQSNHPQLLKISKHYMFSWPLSKENKMTDMVENKATIYLIEIY
jgi:hypothetical protein